MNFSQRNTTAELLDQPHIPFEHIRQNMRELQVINTWLGGHAVTVSGARQYLQPGGSYTICEIGCGGGDNLLAVQRYCLGRGIKAHFIGIDVLPACLEVAKNHTALQGITTWLCCDYRDAVFASKPDVIFSSLFCHHFSTGELPRQMQWMQRNSRLGFFINDLQRHRLPWWLIKQLTRLFSQSYLVKNDAPLSVARSFTRADWRGIMQAAGIARYQLQWKWAFRYLVTYRHAHH